MSLPTALTKSLANTGGGVIDPLITGVALARLPFGRSNYGLCASVSTNGVFGVGISLMNIRILPVLP